MSSWLGLECRQARLKMIASGSLPTRLWEKRWLCRMNLAVKLLETRPTTIVGAAALLIYYVDVVTTTQPDVAFPELDGNARPFESKSIDEPRRDFSYFNMRNVAAALRNIALAHFSVLFIARGDWSACPYLL
jgi:hypothetical protein